MIAAGAVLRLVDLGNLAFRWDEDLSSLAAKAISERGIPELPSGMVYLRSLAFLYVLAASGEIFGFSETALRLPAALFGIATIPLAFAFGKRLFGTGVGLMVAALVAFSVWDIEFSRYARMYAPFEFFYLLTLLCIWRYRVVERSLPGGLLCVGLALITVSLHALGYTLALALLVPLLFDGRSALRRPRRLLFPAAAFSVVAAFFFTWERLQDRYFNRAAIRAAENADATLAAAPAANEAADGVVGVLLAVPAQIAGQLQLPQFPVLSALADAMPGAAAALIAVPVLAALAFLLAFRGRLDGKAGALIAAVAALCAVQLFNLALLATLALAFVNGRGVRAYRSADGLFCIAVMAVSFFAWLGAAVGLGLTPPPPDSTIEKEAVRQLLGYPSFFVFWAYPNEYRLMAIPAAIGGLWALDRAARGTDDTRAAAVFLLAVFAIPTIGNGLFDPRYQTFRYSVPLGPLFFTFVALGIARWRDVAASWRGEGSAPRWRAPALVTAALAAAVLAYDMNPLRSWLVTQRAYADEGPLYSFFGLTDFQDYRSAAEYVRARADAEDIIATFDCREYFNYLGRLDYCIVSRTYRDGDELIQTYREDGHLRDLYLATPMITGADELEQKLRNAHGRAWLLVSDSMAADPNRVDKDLRRFLDDADEHVVYVAPDEETKVYRF